MRARSRMGESLCRRLADGELSLQRCARCRTLHYPPAEICRNCWHDDLQWRRGEYQGDVIATVAVHRSYARDFADGGPWRVASIKLDDGPVCYAHVIEQLKPGTRVHMVPIIDRLGDGVLGAVVDVGDARMLRARFEQ